MKMKEAVAHRRTRIFAVLIALCLAGAAYAVVQTQRAQKKKSPTPGPMLEQGYVELQTPAFSLRLVKSSQTVASLKPKREENFDFTPGDLLVERSKNGYYHLGDIDLRLRTGNSGRVEKLFNGSSAPRCDCPADYRSNTGGRGSCTDYARGHSGADHTELGAGRRNNLFCGLR